MECGGREERSDHGLSDLRSPPGLPNLVLAERLDSLVPVAQVATKMLRVYRIWSEA